jgi:hypothetical protein
MTTTQNKAIVKGLQEVEETYVKRTGKFLIFNTEWYEKVSTTQLGNDIIIKTDRPIRNVILNGKVLTQHMSK